MIIDSSGNEIEKSDDQGKDNTIDPAIIKDWIRYRKELEIVQRKQTDKPIGHDMPPDLLDPKIIEDNRKNIGKA